MNKVNEDLSTHRQQCLDTIQELKNVKLCQYASLYDALHYNATTFADYMDNEIIKTICVTDNLNKFHPYSYMLKEKLQKANARCQLMNKSIFIMRKIFERVLPIYCIRKIAHFLNNNDLEFLNNCEF